MCTYNSERYVDEQLTSFTGQSKLPNELIICDDGSTDSTIERLRAYAQAAPFPVHIYQNEQRLGVLKNFEKAVSLCQGDIIIFSDADDVWLPEKIAQMDAAFTHFPNAGAAFCNSELVDEHLRSLNRTLWAQLRFSAHLQKQMLAGKSQQVMIKTAFAWAHTLAFRAEFKKYLLPYPAVRLFYHDEWTCRLIACLADIIPVPKLDFTHQVV